MRKGALPQGEGLFLFFFFSTSPVRYLLRSFLPHPSSPARRGSTSLLNPPILRREDLKPGRLGLYSQTSFNCVDSRLHSAEHSNEFDALLSLAREFAHKGLLVIAYAIELRVFYAKSRDCLSHNVRVFDAIEL